MQDRAARIPPQKSEWSSIVKRIMTSLAGVFILTGCYHATVETGLAPSPQTLEKGWAAGWLYGLVPPSTVETQKRCPKGVAKVETQLSFPNMIAGALTFSLYTPMSIKVTCAQ